MALGETPKFKGPAGLGSGFTDMGGGWGGAEGFAFTAEFPSTALGLNGFALFSSPFFALAGMLLAAVLTLRSGIVAGGGMARAFFKGPSPSPSVLTTGLALWLAATGGGSIFTVGFGLGGSSGEKGLGDAASMEGREWVEDALLGAAFLTCHLKIKKRYMICASKFMHCAHMKLDCF